MRLLISCFLLTLLCACKRDSLYGDVEESTPANLEKVILTDLNNVGGYYVALPARYSMNKEIKGYPVIINFPGAGAYGSGPDTIDRVLEYGAIRIAAEKKFPPQVTVNNQAYSFIILAPQFITPPTNQEIQSFVDYAFSRYKVDRSRVYLAGSSVGGRMASDFAAANPSSIAALVAMSGVSDFDVASKCKNMVDANLPVWVFHNIEDGSWPLSVPELFINTLSSMSPAITPKFTIMDNVGHDSWVKASNPDLKYDSLNIYEWMLQYHR